MDIIHNMTSGNVTYNQTTEDVPTNSDLGLFEMLPRERRLPEEKLKEAEKLVSLQVNNKLMRDHMQDKTGKKDILKDISNIISKVNASKKSDNIESLVSKLKKTGSVVGVFHDFNNKVQGVFYQDEKLAAACSAVGMKEFMSRMKLLTEIEELWKNNHTIEVNNSCTESTVEADSCFIIEGQTIVPENTSVQCIDIVLEENTTFPENTGVECIDNQYLKQIERKEFPSNVSQKKRKDRAYVIVKPLAAASKGKHYRYGLALSAWVIGCIVAIPYGVQGRFIEKTRECRHELPSLGFVYSDLCTIIVIPVIVISICYILIIIKIRRRETCGLIKVKNNQPGVDVNRSIQIRAISKAKIKTIKLLLVVVFVYIICWAPITIDSLLLNLKGIEGGTWSIVLYVLAPINSLANPL
ncbi:Hypothetical predicted protein, partial [Mytilus galloprovincialis]